MRSIAVAASLVAIVSGAPPQPRPAHPRLAVILVVDQMRADYVERFQDEWTGGLKRLVTNGAWFTNAAYPYLTTVTCAGHATISTGAFPHVHGILGNQWWDRAAGRSVTCTDDPSATNMAYVGKAAGGDSGRALRVATFADRMRAERHARVVTLSEKARSAIMLAGHGGDAVTWLNESIDAWVTSSAYSRAPVPAVAAFIGANRIDADFGQTWVPLLPLARYHDSDDGQSARPPRGWTAGFPHVLNGAAGKPDGTFGLEWDTSPFADAYLGRMAAALVESLQLGRHDTADVLGVSFSATDTVGHKFGPESREVEDGLARLDRTIGTLLDRLDALVGRGEYVVALAADHGVTPIPERLIASGKEGGRVVTAEIVKRIEQRLAELGPGRHVAEFDGRNMNVYFAPGVYEKLVGTPALDDVIGIIASTPGIARVFRHEDLRREGAASGDPVRRAAALSYAEGTSGDLLVALKPGWIASNEAATHGTASRDDQHVPILLMGPGIKAGRYADAVTPADVAPTLAKIFGIALPAAEGHALRRAFGKGVGSLFPN